MDGAQGASLFLIFSVEKKVDEIEKKLEKENEKKKKEVKTANRLDGISFERSGMPFRCNRRS